MNTQKLINHEREIFNKKKSEKKRNFTEKNQSFTQKKHILRQIKKNKEKFQETCWARMTGEDEDDDKDEEATESEFPLRGSTAVPWVDLKNENLGLAVKDETAWNETKPSIFFFSISDFEQKHKPVLVLVLGLWLRHWVGFYG